MEMSKLALARIEQGLTQAEVAAYVRSNTVTVCRWEKGVSQPNPRNILKLCTLFEKTPQELGLTPLVTVEPEEISSPRFPVEFHSRESAFAKFFHRDIGLRLDCIMYDWLHSQEPKDSRAVLQYRISKELEEYESMTNEQQPKQHLEGVDFNRRTALRHLALIPIHALGLDALGAASAPKWGPEDLLTHCAAGITACKHLSTGQYEDMMMAFSVLTTYLPALKEIIEQSSKHRKEAARLVAQSLLVKAMIGVHREGPKRAISYGKQAVIYGKESGDLSLRLVALKALSWIYACDKQSQQALDAILQAQQLLEHAEVPVPLSIQAQIYDGIAKRQAQNGKQDEAFLALGHAQDTFEFVIDGKKSDVPSEENENLNHVDYNESTFIMGGGLTHYYLGQYDEALGFFEQAIDPYTLAPHVPASSLRVRIEILNHQALASLKRSKRDLDFSLNLWKAGIQGARHLHSEQRFNEAVTAYEIMEALWPHEARVKEFRDLTRHW